MPRQSCLRGADVLQKSLQLLLEEPTLLRERVGGGEHLRRGRTGGIGALADIADIAGDAGGAARDLLDVARDLTRRRALLLDRGGDACSNLGDLLDGAADPLDR